MKKKEKRKTMQRMSKGQSMYLQWVSDVLIYNCIFVYVCMCMRMCVPGYSNSCCTPHKTRESSEMLLLCSCNRTDSMIHCQWDFRCEMTISYLDNNYDQSVVCISVVYVCMLAKVCPFFSVCECECYVFSMCFGD